MEIEYLDDVWNKILDEIKKRGGRGLFSVYFKDTRLMEIDNDLAQVSVGNPLAITMLEQKYKAEVEEILSSFVGRTIRVSFKKGERVESSNLAKNEALPLFEPEKIQVEAYKRTNLRESYTFENYAVGGSNQMAFAATQAVSKKPGEAYNPLFLYGGVGVGKTHLMHAVGNVMFGNKLGPILACTGEEFTNDLVESIRFKNTEKVRSKYRRVRLLLIDDIQFIAGKTSVQEEFFHTFNAILKDGGQIIMTSDRPPHEIAKLEDRLKSRFGAGLIVDIGQPDFELRTAILLIKARQRKINISMNIAQIASEKIQGIRELEGFLMKMTSLYPNTEMISQEDVYKILNLKKEDDRKSKIITPQEVMQIISNYYDIPLSQIKGERRTKNIARSRQILMYFLYDVIKLPLEEIGRLLGGRDHSTVIHARDKIRVELEFDPKMNAQIDEIRRKIYL